MKIRIQIVMEAINGESERVEEIVALERSSLQPETLGLTLAESKTVLQGIQECMVSEQVAEYMAQFNTCPDCGARRTKKGQHTLVYRTVFGKLNLISPRLYDCVCHQPHQHRHSSRGSYHIAAKSAICIILSADFLIILTKTVIYVFCNKRSLIKNYQ